MRWAEEGEKDGVRGVNGKRRNITKQVAGEDGTNKNGRNEIEMMKRRNRMKREKTINKINTMR